MYNSYPPFPAVLPMLFVEIDHFFFVIMLLFVYWIDYKHSIGTKKRL